MDSLGYTREQNRYQTPWSTGSLLKHWVDDVKATLENRYAQLEAGQKSVARQSQTRGPMHDVVQAL